MNVKENVFSSEREFKKALRDTFEFKFKFKFSLCASRLDFQPLWESGYPPPKQGTRAHKTAGNRA